MLVLVTGIGSALLQHKPDKLQVDNQERQLSDSGSLPFIPVVLSGGRPNDECTQYGILNW